MTQGAALEIDGVSHAFGAGAGRVQALDGISISVPRGAFVSLVGRSGCGKTTLFNIIAGLLRPGAGRILLDGRDIVGRAGLVSYMLQKDLLLPWRSILDNIVLGMEVRGVGRREAVGRAMPLIERYGLGGFEHQRPAALSGGMRQRAALLRTLLCDRDVLLLDEPFAALDAQTRFDMQQWLLRLWQDFGRTVILVTHDVDEAVFLSDRIYVLAPRPGRVAAEIEVPLARPRPREALTSEAFVRTKQACMQLLFQEAHP